MKYYVIDCNLLRGSVTFNIERCWQSARGFIGIVARSARPFDR